MTKEEAIKLVKRIKGAMVYTEEEKEALETLIPELRESESEDKKFQKYILKACKECVEANDNGLELSMSTTKKLLSYLEKQKAKERFDRMAPIYNDKESFESALEKAWKYYNESASRTVDSFEDDYIECVFSKGFREGFLYKEKQKESLHISEMCKEKANSFTDEDEKTRRMLDIITYKMSQHQPDIFTGEENEWFNAYLEKQKEQKPFTLKYRVGDVMRTKQEAAEGITDGLPVIVSVDEDYYYCTNEKIPISEQEEYEFPPMNIPEQKPTEWSDNFEDNIRTLLHNKLTWHSEDGNMSSTVFIDDKTLKDIISGIWFYVGKEALKYPNKELNVSKWSEEDEDMIANIISSLRGYMCVISGSKNYNNHEAHIQDAINAVDLLGNVRITKNANEAKAFRVAKDWLETLPERFNLQPKQEWSEENDQLIGFIFDLLNDLVWQNDWAMSKEECLERLKSLRPSWKPSEEELVALKRAGGILRDCGHGELAKEVFMIEGKLANLSVINKSIWKPSEEQMEHLKRCFSYGKPHLPMPNQHVLESLHNDLKKLM